jgi:hypothetical protein
MLVLLGYQIAGARDGAILRVVVPATLGAGLGVALVVVRRLRELRAKDARRRDSIAFGLILGAVLVSQFSNHLPSWVSAFMYGWVAGFLVAFDVFVLRLWRSSSEFRERIRSILGT